MLLIVSAAGCASGLTRLDNLIAFAVSIVSVGLIGGAALRPTDRLRLGAQFAAGLLGGMFFGPSTGALLSLALVGLGLGDALKGDQRKLGIVAVLAGAVMGFLMTYAVLMRFFAPTDIRC